MAAMQCSQPAAALARGGPIPGTRARQPGRTHEPECRSLASARAAHTGVAVERWPGAVHSAAGSRQQTVAATAVSDAEQLEQLDEWVEVGRIGPPHGVRGEMKVQPLTDFPDDRLATPGPRWLQAPAPKIGRRQVDDPEEVELEWGRSMVSKGNEVWLVKLVDVESPEEAALLRGHMLLIPSSAREPLQDEDEFYVQDLVGLQVFLQATGEEVGRVSDVFDGTGTHDVMRIQLAPSLLARLAAEQAGGSGSKQEEEEEEEAGQGAEAGSWDASEARHVLLPFAKAMVPVVDLAAGRMEVTPPAGLLELAAPSNLRRSRKESRGRRERRRTRPKGQAAVDAGSSAASSSSEAEQ